MNREADWISEALSEYEAAEVLFKAGYYSWCCFTCQQSAEKGLKAILEHFHNPRIGHNLVSLVEEVEKYNSVPTSLSQACYILNRYYIATRYPDAFTSGAPKDMFSELDAETALRYAKEIVEFAKNIL